MFELRPTFDLIEFSLASASGWFTLAVLFGLIWANSTYAVPGLVATARVLAAARDRSFLEVHINFRLAAIGLPFIIGSVLGLFYLLDRDNFVWYVQDALTLWPDYGSLTCWAVNAALALLLYSVVTTSVAMVRIYRAAGVIAAAGFALLSLGSFMAGVLFGPVGLVLALGLNRREFRRQLRIIRFWAWGF